MPIVTHSNREVRLFAASAIASTGKYGSMLVLELFAKSQDPFFKMNLSIGMICQQTKVFEACQALQQGMMTEAGRWMWREVGAFRVLAPSNVKQDDEIPNAPEAINQLTRLEILNMLAIAKCPEAENSIRTYLQQRKWGLSGLATALLLMEGDESSMELVQGLLHDGDARIQMQAALTLALWGGKEEAIATLERGYEAANRETKEKILEGLGKIGSRASIPFLLERLQEPQQILRLLAASSLLQCLYH
ncbi:MAG: HEAT repeat domain-containing protein [Parachlamydiaceae bacterium]|nr:HEAT repeat domain-containing protein [Parachlamydiaceae bacterium]